MKAEKKVKSKKTGENPMRMVFIERIVLSAGGKADVLEKARKLLEYLTGKKAQIIASNKRIPDFNVNPGLEVGTRVTLRDQEAIDTLKRLLGSIDNTLSKKQIAQNHFSFGIPEYIEIPGTEYKREIGIRGLNVSVVFARKGKRIAIRKRMRVSIPLKQHIPQEEIISFMEKNFKTKVN